MSLGYLGALLVSIAGMLVLDARYRLFLWRAPRAAALTLLVGVGLLLAVDLLAIALGVFRVGDSPALSGVMLAPHLPLEEPVFLVFLCLLTMVVHGLVRRMRRARRTDARG
ncbi:MAG: lycopene cyclase domain-containing protein [Leifsonia xyli]|nr:MAG: lycopene cyclase domain-containing protein [Leifsonia xyli]